MPRYLVDKSALARAHLAPVGARLRPLVEAGEVASCSIVDLELLYSARTRDDYEALLDERRGLPAVDLSQETFNDAIEIQRALAHRGQHRLPIPDLIIAAAARSAGLTVLHYDADFERIAAATPVEHEWIVPAGTV